MTFETMYAQMTQQQFGELMMRVRGQACEIIRLRRIADAARWPVLYRDGTGVEFFDDIPPNAVISIISGTWDDAALVGLAANEVEELAQPLREYANQDDVVTYCPASTNTRACLSASLATVRAFLAAENIWSFLPLTRAVTKAEMWLVVSDDAEHEMVNGCHVDRSIYITHQPAPERFDY